MSLPRLALLVVTCLFALGANEPALGGRSSTAALAAVAPGPLPQPRQVRTGMILSIANTPFYIAQERGYFAAEGLAWQYEPVQVTAEAVAQVGAGNLDAATVTVGAAVLNSVARGVAIKVISGNDGFPPSGPGGNPFLVRKDLYDSGITDASGLRGRRVGGNGTGVFTEYAIDQAMRTAGLTIDDIEFVQVPFPDIPMALANQAIDAAFVAEPFGTVAMSQGLAVQILPEFMRGAQQTVLVGGPTLLGDRPLAEAYLRVFLRGIRDVQREGFSDEIAAIVEKYTRVPAAMIQRLQRPYWDPEGRVNWDSLLDQQRFYMARGYLNYSEPLDLVRVLGEDGPRQAALAALSR
ncbi:MAG TPA: ABC transporter substrate-binding protein [Chloroflexota bacterium]|nr:ABC transporter substrate-binding protein [Chloroflexota bacterium]